MVGYVLVQILNYSFLPDWQGSSRPTKKFFFKWSTTLQTPSISKYSRKTVFFDVMKLRQNGMRVVCKRRSTRRAPFCRCHLTMTDCIVWKLHAPPSVAPGDAGAWRHLALTAPHFLLFSFFKKQKSNKHQKFGTPRCQNWILFIFSDCRIFVDGKFSKFWRTLLIV